MLVYQRVPDKKTDFNWFQLQNPDFDRKKQVRLKLPRCRSVVEPEKTAGIAISAISWWWAFCIIRSWVLWVEFCLISWNSNCQISVRSSNTTGLDAWGLRGYWNGFGQKKIGEQKRTQSHRHRRFGSNLWKKNSVGKHNFSSGQMFHCRMAINSQQTLHVHPQILGTVVHPITNNS